MATEMKKAMESRDVFRLVNSGPIRTFDS